MAAVMAVDPVKDENPRGHGASKMCEPGINTSTSLIQLGFPR